MPMPQGLGYRRIFKCAAKVAQFSWRAGCQSAEDVKLFLSPLGFV